jgi:hypothetical protein
MLDAPQLTEKAREQRLRRLAQRKGLALVKPRSGEMWGGPYWILNPYRNLILSYEHGMTLDEAEAWLNSE